jgi:hypothetical protein
METTEGTNEGEKRKNMRDKTFCVLLITSVSQGLHIRTCVTDLQSEIIQYA